MSSKKLNGDDYCDFFLRVLESCETGDQICNWIEWVSNNKLLTNDFKLFLFDKARQKALKLMNNSIVRGQYE